MFNFDSKLENLADSALKKCEPIFKKIDWNTEYNQQKVLKDFIDCKVSESHFNASTGYGYDDRGRDTLDELYAKIFECEDALVRHNFVSGTHALTVALFGVLRPGDKILSVTGTPYDTLLSVIGENENSCGSLKEFGVQFDYIELKKDGEPDYDKIRNSLKNSYKAVYIQRSRGYSLRKSLYVADIQKIIKTVKEISPTTIVMVDNCYGEFVELSEPTKVGADLIIGSLIKNAGGGLAPTGGYIAGRKDLVEMCSYRLTTPGTGREIGASLGQNRQLFMGIFNAPHVVGEALKTAVFSSAIFENLGYEVFPKYDEHRSDIIQAIKLNNPQSLIAFCKGIQSGSPVDSFVSPEPWDMPGYDSQIIMAAGTFTLGASIELSADAPLRDPYAVWLQGGINFHSAKVGVMCAIQNLIDSKNLSL